MLRKTLDSSLSGDIDGEITVEDMDAVVGSLKNNNSRVGRALSGVL